ncbi:MAG: hypothetical protein IPN88_04110 [Bacteroidetes bacterium]|nr:hypothetical protein [Bacteroidota bacterium]
MSIISFAISTNGWLALVPSTAGLPASNPFPPNPTNSLSTSALGYPVIAPLWDDMAMASIQYNWTAPVLTVKWTGRWDKTNASLTNAFGVKIDGTTGICTSSTITLPILLLLQAQVSGLRESVQVISLQLMYFLRPPLQATVLQNGTLLHVRTTSIIFSLHTIRITTVQVLTSQKILAP